MRRTYTAVVALLLIAGGFVFAALAQSRPRLTVLVDGSPAASVTVTDSGTGMPLKTDSTGTITCDLDPGKQHAVFVPIKGAGQRLVSFPAQGHKTVDFRGRYTHSRTVVYYFGFLRRETVAEQYDLTAAETAAIEAGETTMSQVKKSILSKAEQ